MVESRERAAILAEVRAEIDGRCDELKAMNERLQVALDAVEGCDERCLKLEAERDKLKTKCETREVAYEQADAERKRYSEQIDELFAERERLESQVRQLEGDLKGARKSRDHWQQVAGKHSTEIQRLKRGLKAERELARMWPRFEDGAPVRVGDLLNNVESGEGHAEGIEFRSDGCVIHTTRVNRFIAYGTMLKRPSLKAADGQPIEVGQTLYGGDGQAWEVRNVEHGEKYPVYAVGADDENSYELKQLKPGWLTHERPDSFELLVASLRGLDPNVAMTKDAVNALADRIERLAKEAAR